MSTDNQPMPENDQATTESCSAADALKLAKAELDRAKAAYENMRRQAAECLQSVRQTTIGDLIDATLDGVRRRPGVGLTAAAVVGFLLGRIFRR